MPAMRPTREWSPVAPPSLVDEVRRIPLDPSDVTPGSTLQPIARFVLEHEGAQAASVVFGRAEIFERELTADVGDLRVLCAHLRMRNDDLIVGRSSDADDAALELIELQLTDDGAAIWWHLDL